MHSRVSSLLSFSNLPCPLVLSPLSCWSFWPCLCFFPSLPILLVKVISLVCSWILSKPYSYKAHVRENVINIFTLTFCPTIKKTSLWWLLCKHESLLLDQITDVIHMEVANMMLLLLLISCPPYSVSLDIPQGASRVESLHYLWAFVHRPLGCLHGG